MSPVYCVWHCSFQQIHISEITIGISVTQDIFQQMLYKVYKVASPSGDILIIGSTEQESDKAFIIMLETTSMNIVNLNSGKLQFNE